jgi:hypothetical protein
MTTKENKQHSLRNVENQQAKQCLLSMNVLVGDEIQHRVIKLRRG